MELELKALKAIKSKCSRSTARGGDHNFVPPVKGPSGKRVTAIGPMGEEITGDVYRCYYCDEYFFVPINEKYIGVIVKIKM